MNEASFEGFRIVQNCFDPVDWTKLLPGLLPTQGSIELQNDQAGKEFARHVHPTDETLLILAGSVRFYWDSGETICLPGDVICLPAGMPHGSVALDEGARYAIVMHRTEHWGL